MSKNIKKLFSANVSDIPAIAKNLSDADIQNILSGEFGPISPELEFSLSVEADSRSKNNWNSDNTDIFDEVNKQFAPKTPPPPQPESPTLPKPAPILADTKLAFNTADAFYDNEALRIREISDWNSIVGKSLFGVVIALCPNPKFAVVAVRTPDDSGKTLNFKGTVSIPDRYRSAVRSVGKRVKVEFLPKKGSFLLSHF